MNVPMLDLKAQHAPIAEEIQAAVASVFESQRFILGPEVEALEAELAAYCGVEHAVGTSSGTDALLMALLDAGVGPDTEVITTPFSFFATAGVVARLGASCVFVDIEKDGFNIDAARVAEYITPKTKAILPVHLFGEAADLAPMRALAESHDLFLCEDAAQAIGAEDTEGKRCGSLGHAGCFSFFPSKNLGAAGDGGLITCRDEAQATRLRQLRVHGASRTYRHEQVGGNFRLDALQAAVLRVKLKHLDDWSNAREANAKRYDALFVERALVETNQVRCPVLKVTGRQVFNQYTIRVDAEKRDGLREHLQSQGIGCAVYYPLPLHLQPCFADWGYRAHDFPLAEMAASEVLSLPVYPELSDEQAAHVVDSVEEFLCP